MATVIIFPNLLRSRFSLGQTIFAMLAAVIVIVALPDGARAQDFRAKSVALVQSATASVRPFLTDPRWVSVRNALGGARAVFIVPHDMQGGFLLTASGGDGVLLRRHGTVWSDPIFLHVSSVGVGFEAGAENQSLVILIMSDAGIDQLLRGATTVGGSGGFALGSLGVSGGASGNSSQGLEVLSVATAQGIFAGSGISGMQVSSDTTFNQAVYGADYSMQTIAAGNGGAFAAGEMLRGLLIQAVTQAWYQ
jgi:lipid-binding SYLF domain-containing protein